MPSDAAEDADVVNQNPLECMCPDCDSPKMDGARFCIQCYDEGCKAYTDTGARCNGRSYS